MRLSEYFAKNFFKVSIHASVKDATSDIALIIHSPNVSIHASVKDATVYQIVNVIDSQFQSTHL